MRRDQKQGFSYVVYKNNRKEGATETESGASSGLENRNRVNFKNKIITVEMINKNK